MLKKKIRPSTKKHPKGANIDDKIVRSIVDIRQLCKKPDEHSFGKFRDCDFVYIINDNPFGRRKLGGSMIVLVKDEIILDIFGPVDKIYLTSEQVHGETLYLQFIAKNKFKIKHTYFKLAVSFHKGCVKIEPRNIFNHHFLYDK